MSDPTHERGQRLDPAGAAMIPPPPKANTFAVLNDGDYKVYRRAGWDILARYTVALPGGGVLGVVSTLWGARRLIRRHKAKVRRQGGDRRWWDEPIAYREPA